LNETRHKRLAIAGRCAVRRGGRRGLVLNAFQSNLVFFYSPTQVAAKEAPPGAPSASAAWWKPAASSATA
jgi:cytochrome c-type biogenesis protein CcmE